MTSPAIPRPAHAPLDLGSWTLPSGNQCHAALVKNIPDEVGVKFTWSSEVTPQDREDFKSEVLPFAMQRAEERLFHLAEIVRSIQQLVKDGIVEPIGVRNGDIVYAKTEGGCRRFEGSMAASPASDEDGEFDLVPTEQLIEALRRRCDALVLGMVQIKTERDSDGILYYHGFSLTCMGLLTRLAHRINHDDDQRPEGDNER
jgi:hypothetical protein